MALVPWPGGNIQTIFARVVLLAPYYTNPFLGGVPLHLRGKRLTQNHSGKENFKNNKKENLAKTIED